MQLTGLKQLEAESIFIIRELTNAKAIFNFQKPFSAMYSPIYPKPLSGLGINFIGMKRKLTGIYIDS